jgi:hypothetical protein
VSRKTFGLLQRGLQQIRATVGALLVEARLDSPRLSAQDNVLVGALARPGLPAWRSWARLYPAALRAEASTRALTTGAPTAPAAQLLRDITTGATYIPLSAECTPAINATAAALVARNASASFLDRYVAFEQECSNGLDDDCDGLVDSEDPDCPFQPVAYTPQQLAWTPGEPLPSAAGAALLSLAYARSAGAAGRLSGSQRRSLQCWALGQAYYMLGATGGQLRGGGG